MIIPKNGSEVMITMHSGARYSGILYRRGNDAFVLQNLKIWNNARRVGELSLDFPIISSKSNPTRYFKLQKISEIKLLKV